MQWQIQMMEQNSTLAPSLIQTFKQFIYDFYSVASELKIYFERSFSIRNNM